MESVIPLLVLAFGFGLSMDYEVFLLSRIIELHEHGSATPTRSSTGSNAPAASSARPPSLVVIVFAGFAAGELLIIKGDRLRAGRGRRDRRHPGPDAPRPCDDDPVRSMELVGPGPLRRLHDRFAIVE